MLIRDEKEKIEGSDLSEFEELLKKIQEQKPELTKQDIDGKIKQKMEKIGPGYLTNEGALFLIVYTNRGSFSSIISFYRRNTYNNRF